MTDKLVKDKKPGLSPEQEKCMKESLEWIAEVADKYSLRFLPERTLNSGPASNVLVGNVAFEKYKECVAKGDGRER